MRKSLNQGLIPYFCRMEKQILLGKTPAEIQEVVEKMELPKFTGFPSTAPSLGTAYQLAGDITHSV